MRPREELRWLVAAGILGLAASPGIARAVREARIRAARGGGPGSDPVEAFRAAPCYAPSSAGGAR